jgi:hypothetical protein
MNFDEAITAHSQWKIRLQSAINGTNKEVLDPATICVDNRCTLGQWIYGEAKEHSTLKEYEVLRLEHAHFHQCAAEVVRTFQAGETDKARAALESGGHFHAASIKTINAIRHLRTKVEK